MTFQIGGKNEIPNLSIDSFIANRCKIVIIEATTTICLTLIYDKILIRILRLR